MAEPRHVRVMRRRVGPDAAASSVAALAGEADRGVAAAVYYPFHAWSATGRLRTLAGTRRVACYGVVDARTGDVATSDPLDTEELAVAPDALLAARHGSADALRMARSFAAHALRRRLRVICDFRLELSELGLVYRPYWIVRAGAALVLVDAVTGGLHPLAEPASIDCGEPCRATGS